MSFILISVPGPAGANCNLLAQTGEHFRLMTRQRSFTQILTLGSVSIVQGKQRFRRVARLNSLSSHLA